jgi:hypothetical protein
VAARLVKVFHVRLDLGEVAEGGPHPLAALNREVGAARVLREQRALRNEKARAQEPAPAPIPPQAETPDDSAVMGNRDEKTVAVDRKRGEYVEPILLDEPPSIWRRRQSEPDERLDERLSVGTIAVTMAAVIVVCFGITALLPAILTRDAVDSATTDVGSPVSVPLPQFGEVQAPAPDLPARDAQSAPVLRTTSVPSRVPPANQVASRTAGADVPSAGKAAATSLANLAAAEKAGATRGRDDLKTTATAAVAPPRRPARRPALTDEEKAAVERGLRELEKTAGQADLVGPQGQR